MVRQVAAGLVVGVMAVSIALALATFVFRGAFAVDLGHGVGWALAGLAVLGLAGAVGSSVRGMAAGPQDVPAVVLAGVVIELGRRGATLETLAAFMVLATAVTGVTMLVVGRRRLGALARFVPYSVVAAFLGGTSVVLIMAGLAALTGGHPTAEPGLRLVPGLALAAALVWTGRRQAPQGTGAALIGVAFAGYHLAAAAAGIGRGEAVARGLVLGPFPGGSLVDAGVVLRLGDADWGAVLGQSPAIVVLALLTLLALLLNVGALEHELQHDIDIDRELEVTGVGLLAAAPLAGPPGFALLGPTLMGRRLGGPSRVPPVVAAGLAVAVLAAGADLLTLVPVLVTGGLLLTIGGEFAVTWLWDVRHRVSRLEHLVILAIVTVIATVGIVQGVGLGILAATMMFVVRYSRVQAVRSFTTLRDRRSHVQRGLADEAVLDEVGHRVAIAELQGFVFFGTAEQVLAAVHDRMDGDDRIEVLVVDLARVTGLDSSAVTSFQRLARRARDHGVELVLSSADPSIRALLAPVLDETSFDGTRDLDHVLEHYEDALLAGTAAAGAAWHGAQPLDGRDGPWAAAPATAMPAGSTIVTQGERDVGLFLLEAGRATVRMGADPTGARQAVLLPGTVIGELSLLTGSAANATVVCQTDCVVRHLSTAAVAELAATHPDRALELYRFIARRLARKLAAASRTIVSLR